MKRSSNGHLTLSISPPILTHSSHREQHTVKVYPFHTFSIAHQITHPTAGLIRTSGHFLWEPKIPQTQKTKARERPFKFQGWSPVDDWKNISHTVASKLELVGFFSSLSAEHFVLINKMASGFFEREIASRVHGIHPEILYLHLFHPVLNGSAPSVRGQAAQTRT